jgi:hypothetical protein
MRCGTVGITWRASAQLWVDEFASKGDINYAHSEIDGSARAP